MKEIEFVSRITVNGEKKEISREEAQDIIIKSQDKALGAMSYERKEARLIRQEVQMKDLIDSILIGSCAHLPPILDVGRSRDQIAGAVALVMIILLQRRWKKWTS